MTPSRPAGSRRRRNKDLRESAGGELPGVGRGPRDGAGEPPDSGSGARDSCPMPEDLKSESLGEHLGYALVRDWTRIEGRLTCLGYRASSRRSDAPADGEGAYFDGEEDLRAAIEATFREPAGGG